MQNNMILTKWAVDTVAVRGYPSLHEHDMSILSDIRAVMPSMLSTILLVVFHRRDMQLNKRAKALIDLLGNENGIFFSPYLLGQIPVSSWTFNLIWIPWFAVVCSRKKMLFSELLLDPLVLYCFFAVLFDVCRLPRRRLDYFKQPNCKHQKRIYYSLPSRLHRFLEPMIMPTLKRQCHDFPLAFSESTFCSPGGVTVFESLVSQFSPGTLVKSNQCKCKAR